ncbi:MetQ/NlpA family ABC transporter substrate-binding protein [Pseudarthrobacter sp. J75]|uniref:MetQ/NlpA family ABC transporter substrate-binding protein n=1 Tax=unclassified Pseudarthrobacter TaxID=2647000 RepID=UPI002E7FF092|nr:MULTISPECIES: MetQ/NlpA family ABC transporter substrate-binding protein [unclassified Pseudarthrobacter]MEE2521330.1 MetQ/NlpA family ABC transporter substrate-binding protein [Pseudarthrobacter sp. J47]MEE2528562.1 MetQ/NlpA family ABC transporter substrate-binding protein [Pseudarthrobacter sp. J75]
MRKSLSLLATGIVTALALTACGASSGTSEEVTTLDPNNPVTLSVGASPVPQAKILEFINEDLAPKAGLKLDIKEIEDYQTPNTALSDGSLDTNYYQHLPWYEDQVKTKGYKFGHGEGVHIEPYAAFSEKVQDIKDIQDGAKIAITNDPSNQVRALRVLEVAGLVKDIKDDSSVLTLTDEQNPKKLEFSENQPELLINDLKDPSVDLALINGNFILKAGLSTKDALAVESVENNPYANFLAWREDSEDDVRIQKLEELLHSPEVKAFIEKEWPNGDVTVAF